MSYPIIVFFLLFGLNYADETRLIQCLKAKSIDPETLSNFGGDMQQMYNSTQKCTMYCILREAVEPRFMSDDGNINIDRLKEHLLLMAESEYAKNEILMSAKMCAWMQNEETYDECEKAYKFATCFGNMKRVYCHSLFPCSDNIDDNNCHAESSKPELDEQSILKLNYTTATDWLRDREEVSKCRFLCMSRVLNYVDAAVVMNQKWISRISKPYPLLVKKRIKSAIQACSERNELDPCERWYRFARCQSILVNDLL